MHLPLLLCVNDLLRCKLPNDFRRRPHVSPLNSHEDLLLVAALAPRGRDCDSGDVALKNPDDLFVLFVLAIRGRGLTSGDVAVLKKPEDRLLFVLALRSRGLAGSRDGDVGFKDFLLGVLAQRGRGCDLGDVALKNPDVVSASMGRGLDSRAGEAALKKKPENLLLAPRDRDSDVD